MSASKKVLVTGASGYLASHVTKALQEAGHEVRGTVRSVTNEVKVKPLRSLCPTAAHELQLVEADLLQPESWQQAVAGMDYVMHVASPFPLANPKDENEVIKPAVEGTLNVLRACAKEPSVKRVVLTGSATAVYAMSESSTRPLTEDDWSDVSRIAAYAKSKTLAEKAAWDFIKQLQDGNSFELAVLNPTLILGPALHGSQCTSLEIIQQLLERQSPLIPRINMPFVDVRDLAQAHVQAMTVPEAAGHRHICNHTNMWLRDIALILKAVFGPQGYNIPTAIAPKPLLWLASFFDSRVQSVLPHVGTVHIYENTRMREVLGVQPREARDTLVEMAYSLIEAGFVPKTSRYRGPGGPEERDMYMKIQLP